MRAVVNWHGADGAAKAPVMTKWRLVIHGGAGSMRPSQLDPEQERCARNGLEAALAAGSAILEKRGSALDAV